MDNRFAAFTRPTDGRGFIALIKARIYCLDKGILKKKGEDRRRLRR